MFAATPSLADGPFGVTMGQDPGLLKECKPRTERPGWYICSALPRTHPDMEAYQVQAFPETGVCFVKAIGKDIQINPFGTSLKAKVDSLEAQVAETYGRSQKRDFLRSGSVWKEAAEWTTGLS